MNFIDVIPAQQDKPAFVMLGIKGPNYGMVARLSTNWYVDPQSPVGTPEMSVEIHGNRPWQEGQEARAQNCSFVEVPGPCYVVGLDPESLQLIWAALITGGSAKCFEVMQKALTSLEEKL